MIGKGKAGDGRMPEGAVTRGEKRRDLLAGDRRHLPLPAPSCRPPFPVAAGKDAQPGITVPAVDEVKVALCRFRQDDRKMARRRAVAQQQGDFAAAPPVDGEDALRFARWIDAQDRALGLRQRRAIAFDDQRSLAENALRRRADPARGAVAAAQGAPAHRRAPAGPMSDRNLIAMSAPAHGRQAIADAFHHGNARISVLVPVPSRLRLPCLGLSFAEG